MRDLLRSIHRSTIHLRTVHQMIMHPSTIDQTMTTLAQATSITMEATTTTTTTRRLLSTQARAQTPSSWTLPSRLHRTSTGCLAMRLRQTMLRAQLPPPLFLKCLLSMNIMMGRSHHPISHLSTMLQVNRQHMCRLSMMRRVSHQSTKHRAAAQRGLLQCP